MVTLNRADDTKTEDFKDLWINVPKNGSLDIIPLASRANGDDSIITYNQFEFGIGSEFWTITDDNEFDHPCRLMGFESKQKWIMPVLVKYENDKWSTPRYLRMPKTVFEALKIIETSILDYAKTENEPTFTFKHSIIKISREDKPNTVTKYFVNWTGRHLSKSMKGKPLPENTLDMFRAVFGITEEFSDKFREKVLERLIQKSEFEVDGKTIGERLAELKLTAENESEFEVIE